MAFGKSGNHRNFTQAPGIFWGGKQGPHSEFSTFIETKNFQARACSAEEF